jgi:tetratricopeptide (TPR) repeat protein
MSAHASTPSSPACQIDPAATPEPNSGLERLLVALAALLCLLTPFLIDFDGDGVVGSELVGDGRVIVTQHPVHRTVDAHPIAVLGAFTTDWYAQTQPRSALYRPVPTFLVGLAALVASSGQEGVYDLDAPGSSALPFKFVAVALKVVCALLVLELAFLLTGKRRIAFLAALLFAVLPVHGAAVFDVAGIATTTASAFMLGAWILWLRAGDSPFARPLALVGAAGCTLLAALSMETAFVLPLVLLAADAGRSGAASLVAGVAATLKRKGAALGVVAGALVVALVLRFAVTGQILPQYLPGSEVENPLVAAGLLTRVLDGLRLAIFGLPIVVGLNPFNTPHVGFSADYSAPQIALGNAFGLQNLLGLAAWALALGAAVFVFRSCRTRGSLLLATLASLLAAAHLVAPAGEVFNERLLFFPSAIVAVLIAASVAPLVGRLGTAGLGVYGAAIVGLGFLVVQRADVYATETSLWRITSRESARSASRAHFNYGRELLRQESASSAASALASAIRPIADEPPTQHTWARALLALAHVTNGEKERAVAPLQEAIDIQIERAGGTWHPSVWDAYTREDRVDVLLWQLTELQSTEGLDRAGHLAYLDGLLARGYASPYVHLRRAETLRQLERFQEAETAYRAGIAIEPLFSLVRGFGRFLRLQGRSAEVEQLYADQLRRLESEARTSTGHWQEFKLQSADLAYERQDTATASKLLEEVLASEPVGALRFRALQMKANLLIDVLPQGDTPLAIEIDRFRRYDEAVGLLRDAIYGYEYRDELTDLAYQTYSALLYELRRYRAAVMFLGPVVTKVDTATLRLRLGECQYWLADESNWSPSQTNMARQNLAIAADQFRNLSLRARDTASGLTDMDQALLAKFYSTARLYELRTLRGQGRLADFEAAVAEEYARAENELGALIVRVWLEIEQGRYEEARLTLSQLQQRDPRNADFWRFASSGLDLIESRLSEIGSTPTPAALREVAFVQFELNDHGGAQTAVAKAMQLAASDPVELARCRELAARFTVIMRGPADALKLIEDAIRDLGDADPALAAELGQRREVLNAMMGRRPGGPPVAAE